MKSKSIYAVILSLLFFNIIPFYSYSTNASPVEVNLGDANGDGILGLSDSICILQYLTGNFSVSQYCFTAMDINNDKVVDKTDAYIIQYKALNNLAMEKNTKELYTLPDNSRRWYTKYNCSTGETRSYYIDNASELNLNTRIESGNRIAPDYIDYGNINVVKLEMSDGSTGSGFVIDEHTIATAAHCVYDSNFVSGVTVKIYNNNAEAIPANLIASFEADSYHVPDLFMNTTDATKSNYDYALIHVANDLSGNNLLDYVAPWDLGIASTAFSEDETGVITSSGFTVHGTCKRYYSTGTVVDFSVLPNEEHNNPNLRIASLGASYPGKSGGAIYYNSSYQLASYKSIVGIVVSGNGSTIGTWGTRFNPTLIRFYKQNTNINLLF